MWRCGTDTGRKTWRRCDGLGLEQIHFEPRGCAKGVEGQRGEIPLSGGHSDLVSQRLKATRLFMEGQLYGPGDETGCGQDAAAVERVKDGNVVRGGFAWVSPGGGDGGCARISTG